MEKPFCPQLAVSCKAEREPGQGASLLTDVHGDAVDNNVLLPRAVCQGGLTGIAAFVLCGNIVH